LSPAPLFTGRGSVTNLSTRPAQVLREALRGSCYANLCCGSKKGRMAETLAAVADTALPQRIGRL
jgi:hypothetical protein